MWSSIASILTASTMALHALLGCCWHHAHAEHEPAAVSAVPGDPDRVRPACPHAHGGERLRDVRTPHEAQTPHEGEGEEDHHHGPCHEPDCVYTLSPDGPVFPQLQDAFCMLSATDVSPPALPVLTADFGTDDSPRCSPREHCALFQVWLI